MKTLVRGTAVLALVMLVTSCSDLLKKMKGEKEGEEDAGIALEASVVSEVVVDAAPPPAQPALATNEGDVARFPDETALAEVSATLQRSYNVREAPPAGAVVAGLSKGTTVSQIAQHGTSFLIVFDNPKAPGTKLMGWIHRDAFSAVIQDAGPLVCPKGEIKLFGDTPFCGKLCSADADCPTGQACKGQANKLLANGKAGDGVTVCTVFHPHDAGAPAPAPVVDAGTPPAPVDAAAPDAAAPPPAPVVVDAGKPPAPVPPPTPAAPDVVGLILGAMCPTGYVKVDKTGKCHRSCATGKDQTERIKNCKNPNPFCIKCDKDEKKVCADSQLQCR